MKKRRKKPLIIGIQGGKGSFNEEAIRRYMASQQIEDFKIVYLYTTKRVLKALHNRKIDRGMFAIQNTIGGTVWETINALSEYNCKILDSYTMHISHHLFGYPGIKLSQIKYVMSHPQGFLQTKKTLAKKFPKLRQRVGGGILVDQATVAKYIRLGKLPKTTAVIASAEAGRQYGLDTLARTLEDHKNNLTTFLFAGRFNGKSAHLTL